MIWKGKDLFLFHKVSDSCYRKLAMSTACELSTSMELKECSSPTQGDWREFLAGLKEWTVSSAHALVLPDPSGIDIRQLYLASAPVAVCFATAIVGDEVRDEYTQMSDDFNCYGLAFIQELTFSGQAGRLASWSVKLKGTGALHFDTAFELVDWVDPKNYVDGEEYKERRYKI